MDPARRSPPEARAYRMLQAILADLRRTEQILADLDHAAPDLERAVHLVAIRAALAQLETFVVPGLP